MIAKKGASDESISRMKPGVRAVIHKHSASQSDFQIVHAWGIETFTPILVTSLLIYRVKVK